MQRRVQRAGQGVDAPREPVRRSEAEGTRRARPPRDPAAGVCVSVFVRLDGGKDIADAASGLSASRRDLALLWAPTRADSRACDATSSSLPRASTCRSRRTPRRGCPVPLTIVRTAPKTFVVRGTDAEEVASRGAAQSDRREVRPPRGADPFVDLPAKDSWDRLVSRGRGFARVREARPQLPLLPVRPETALREEFDPVRRLARFSEAGAFGELVVLSMMNGGRDVPNPYADPSRHALVLQEVELAGRFRNRVPGQPSRVRGWPRALPGTPSPMLPPGTWRVSYFDHVRKAVEHLAVPRDGLGASPTWPILPGSTPRLKARDPPPLRHHPVPRAPRGAALRAEVAVRGAARSEGAARPPDGAQRDRGVRRRVRERGRGRARPGDRRRRDHDRARLPRGRDRRDAARPGGPAPAADARRHSPHPRGQGAPRVRRAERRRARDGDGQRLPPPDGRPDGEGPRAADPGPEAPGPRRELGEPRLDAAARRSRPALLRRRSGELASSRSPTRTTSWEQSPIAAGAISSFGTRRTSCSRRRSPITRTPACASSA